MLPYWWQGGVAVLSILFFVTFFRRYVLSLSPKAWVVALTDFATVATVAATSLYLLEAGLESAMVQLAAAGEVRRGALFGLFAAWDWTYNSFAYFYEARTWEPDRLSRGRRAPFRAGLRSSPA